MQTAETRWFFLHLYKASQCHALGTKHNCGCVYSYLHLSKLGNSLWLITGVQFPPWGAMCCLRSSVVCHRSSSFKVKGLLHVLCVSTRESVSSSPSRLPNTFLFHKVVLEVEHPWSWLCTQDVWVTLYLEILHRLQTFVTAHEKRDHPPHFTLFHTHRKLRLWRLQWYL